MTTMETEHVVLTERHSAGDGVTVEVRYSPEGKVATLWIADPLGEEEVMIPEDVNPLDWFAHPYALAFPGRNPWAHDVIYATTEADIEAPENFDETAAAAA